MYYDSFIHSSVNGHLGYSHVLAIVNCTAMNNAMNMSSSTLVYSRYMPRSGIAGSYGGFRPRFLRNLHTIFHRGCQFTFPPTVQELSFSTHPLQHLLFVDFLMMVILTGVRWYLIVVLICISLRMNDVEYLFICLLTICMSSLEKCLFRSLAQFWLGSLFFWNWAAVVACIFLRLVVCQLLHLLLFSPILKAVFSPCL